MLGTLRVGVIGLGSMGRNHARILSGMGILNGVADIVPALAKSTGKRFSVKHYVDYRDMFVHDFDAIIVATPTNTHKKITSRAISAGKHVLLEKPMTGNSRNLTELVDMANRKKVVLAGGFIERHNPAVEFAKRNIQSKVYGELITAATRRVSSMPTRVKDVGVIMDLGIHDIDVLQHVIAKRPRTVYALGGVSNGGEHEDHANILVDYDGGETGFVEVNWLTPMKVRKFALTCSKNFIEIDYMDQSALICSSSFRPFELGNMYNAPIEFDMRKVALKKEEPLRREIRDFLESVDEGSTPLVTGDNAVMTLKIAEAALKSLKSGGRQTIKSTATPGS